MLNIAVLALEDFENWNNTKSLSMGGITGVIKSILPYLKADNIFLLGITSERKNLFKKIHFAGNIFIVPVAYVPQDSVIPVRLYSFWAGRKINSILKKYDIRSVYSHSVELSYWINPGIPILLHMHGATNALEKSKKKLFRNRLFQQMWEHVRTVNLKKAIKIIAIDPLCFNLTKKHNVQEKAILLPNFVDDKVFYKDKTQSLTLKDINENILLFVGRIEEVKGIELFVDTLISLDKKESGKWKAVFIGRGTYEPIIKDYISGKSDGSLFCFLGPVFEQDELRRIYSKSSVLMISSTYEGIPMVILECLACGTPVVSTNVGGIKEFISDNKMCFVNDSRDPDEFSDLILSIKNRTETPVLSDFRFSTEKASLIINQILHPIQSN
jgi:glycosyltransferase involved in cell wall biosynthesis